MKFFFDKFTDIDIHLRFLKLNHEWVGYPVGIDDALSWFMSLIFQENKTKLKLEFLCIRPFFLINMITNDPRNFLLDPSS